MENINKKCIQIERVNELVSERPEEFISFISNQYHNEVKEVARSIAENKNYKIIMLSGPSGSGKTTTAHLLQEYMAEMGVGSEIISLDDFYLGADKAPLLPDGRRDYETVEALNIPVMQECMKGLIEQGRCDMPQFDFTRGCPKDKTIPIELSSDEVAIFEGIHALNPLIIDALPAESLCRIYVSVKTGIYDGKKLLFSPRELRLIRRTVRDYKFRNSSPKNTLQMWTGVIMGEDKYLKPYRKTAEYRINSVHAFEPAIMKRLATELFSTVKVGDENYILACEVLRDLESVTEASEEYVPENSLMREFIGK